MTSSTKIRVLNDQTINKIAAGEVIENPASVVKELVENSLDAGASDICVEIQAGGRQLIRISDDGCGMSSDDAVLCLERHATSKIKEVEDIQDLLTMGFRGEAIPSIAAISKFTLLTCPRLEGKPLQGTLVLVDGGRLISCSPAARAPGTTIEVKSLFFNVPVRRKFQRSPSYDAQEIAKILSTLALGHPSVQFELVSDQKSIFKTSALPPGSSFQDKLFKRVESLLGKGFAASLCPLNFIQAPYELHGFIGLPSVHKPNRTSQYLFINQRAVYSPLIGVSIREGYGTMLGTNRYPVFVLHLNLPGTFLDVNVHPQKKEVRLRQEQKLKEALMEAIQASLRQGGADLASPQDEEKTSFRTYIDQSFSLSDSYASLLPPFSKEKNFQVNEEKWEFKANPVQIEAPSSLDRAACLPASLAPSIQPAALSSDPPLLIREKPVSSSQAPTLFSALPSKSAPRVGLTLLGYLVLDPFTLNAQLPISSEKEAGGLCLIDQKAAYSRVYYEQLLKRSKEPCQAMHPLLVPLTLQFSGPEAALLKEHLEPLNQLGFSIREFGDQTFVLDGFPAIIKREEVENCLLRMAQDLLERQETRQLQIKKEEKLALAACRASLPKTKRLSLEEAQGLVDQLFNCQVPFQCPLGKEIFIYLSPDELAAYFI